MTMTADAEEILAHAEVVCRTDELEYEEWLEERKPYLGASEAAASIGLSPYDSPLSLFLAKSEGLVVEDNDFMKWGRRLEEAIGLGISEDTGIPVTRFPYMLRSKEWPWMSVNLDFLSGETDEYPSSVVEVKNVSVHLASEWEDGNVPAHYQLQGQHACAVTGLPGVHFFPLIGGNDARPVYVERNDSLIEKLVEGERKFWDMVQNNIQPAADASDATKRALKGLYAVPVYGSSREIPAESIHLLRERREAKRIIKEQTEYVQEIENRLMDWMGKAEIGTVNGVTVVTWKKTNDREGFFVPPRQGERRWNVPKGSPALAPES